MTSVSATMRLADLVDIDPYLHMPLNLQVKTALARLLDRGELNGQLPSPGQLARELRVFSGSIRRAYDELVADGRLCTEGFDYRVAAAESPRGASELETELR